MMFEISGMVSRYIKVLAGKVTELESCFANEEKLKKNDKIRGIVCGLDGKKQQGEEIKREKLYR